MAETTAPRNTTGRAARVWRYARAIGQRHPRRGLQFLARSARHWATTVRWLAFLDDGPLASTPALLRRDLAQRIQRPFSRCWLSHEARARILTDHYTLMVGRLGTEALTGFLTAPGLELVRLTGRCGEAFHIRLMRDDRYAKEGELTFAFAARDAAGKPSPPLATLTGVLTRDPRGATILSIGGLQGPPPPLGRRDIARATRALDGLRPKHAVLQAARAFARWFPAAAITAVAPDGHIHVDSTRRRDSIKADYAGFWLEQGGKPKSDGDYELPLRDAARSPDLVESKRRAEWLRRHRRHDAIAHDTAAALDTLAGRRQAAANSTAITSPGAPSSAETRAPWRSHTAATRLRPSPLPGVVRLASQR